MKTENMTTLKYLYSVEDLAPGLHDDLNRFALYLDAMGYQVNTLDIEQLQQLASVEQEHWLGQWESPAQFAQASLNEAYQYEIEALPTMIQSAIDWAQVWDRDYRYDCLEVEAYDDGRYQSFIWHAH
jgi:hypothetical protein